MANKKLKTLIVDGDDTHHALIELKDMAGKIVAHEVVGAKSEDRLMDGIGDAIKALVDDNAIWPGQSINIAEFDAG